MIGEKKPVVLHIDDNEANRYAVKLILERSGFDILEAETGEEGIRLASELPDLIILDIKLPDINGFEVCRKIKSDASLNFIPVLQTSATFVTSEDKVEGLDSGADGYLAQPIDAAVLVATVRSLLRIRRAEREALLAKQSRDEMLAIVSHDLRNPLTAIKLQVSLLTKGHKKISEEEFQGKMNKMTQACNRMNRLIQDLLDVSSMESDKFSVEKKPFSALALTNEALSSFEDLASEAEISLVKSVPDLDVQMSGDRERILQVLVNLISNALKFTPASGKITLGLQELDHEVQFCVSDTGSGIAPEHLQHIFDRFWQGHKVTRLGVGLGLSIVKGIVKAHDGRISVESKLGEGTKFTITLPK